MDGALRCAGKFLKKPVEVLLFKRKIVALLEIHGLNHFQPLHFKQNVFFETEFLPLHPFVRLDLLVDLLVQFFHLFVANALLGNEFALGLSLIGHVFYFRIQTFRLDLFQVLHAHVAFATA